MADWDGAHYGAVSDLQRAMAAESLGLLELEGEERLLDVGCGDGYVTARIAELLPRGSVVGVDPSPRMIEAAQRRVTTAAFRLGDVASLAFDGEFDVVTSFNALHWVHDQAGAYRAIAAALKPGGRALVTFVCAGPRRSVEDVAMAVCREKRWAAAFDNFDAPFIHPAPDAFERTVTAAGFDILTQAVLDKAWDFTSREAFTQWCAAGFSDWTGRLGAPQESEFVDDVVDRYRTVAGRDGLLAFYQLRAELRRPG